jgi:hypothetical protein
VTFSVGSYSSFTYLPNLVASNLKVEKKPRGIKLAWITPPLNLTVSVSVLTFYGAGYQSSIVATEVS